MRRKWLAELHRRARLRAARKDALRLGDLGVGVLDSQKARELTRVEHLLDDVATADELALHVELREGRPVGELLGHLAQRLERRQYVDRPVLDAERLHYLDHAHGKAAARRVRRALHEEEDGIVGQDLLDL